MKYGFAGLALTACLMASPVLAGSQDPIVPADQRDMECAALFAAIGGMQPEAAESAAVGMTYYLGRLEGRNPGTSQVTRFFEWVSSKTEEELAVMLDAAAPRCGAEMETLGTSLMKAGSAFGG
jgi:hypothetical protein